MANSDAVSSAAAESDLSLALIGGGNMGGSILSGLLDGGADAKALLLVEPDESKRDHFAGRGVAALSQADARLGGAKMVLFAVKPQMIGQVAGQVLGFLSAGQLCASIVAGISSEGLASMLGGPRPIVRCMPNVPALYRTGVTGMFANSLVSDEQRKLADRILKVVGVTEWFDEEGMIDSVTAVMGSGPAYFFYLMEVMQNQAEFLGFSPDRARQLVAETAYGAALMVRNKAQPFADLRRMVTSPKGTTEAAITTFDASGVKAAVAEGIQSAWNRSKQLEAECNE